MKVSQTMFGRPGKCIACRQKIRIPRLDELPDHGEKIYLKDHPEFLRKPPRPTLMAKAQVRAAEEAEEDVIALGEAQDDLVAFDVLLPLQKICSFDMKIRRQLNGLRKSKRGSRESGDKAAMMGYRALVRRAREDMDDQLRARLVASREQLTSVKEQLALLVLKVRLGEQNYSAYRESVMPLRLQRERLERHIQNLRGWLATTDPYLAGGYLDLRLEEVPCEGLVVKYPVESRVLTGNVEQLIEQLRGTFRNREQLTRQWVELERMKAEGDVEVEEEERTLAGQKKCAEAELDFVQKRLKQVVQDCHGDVKAIKAYLELAQQRLGVGELERGAYQDLENDLLHGQSDSRRARELAEQALSAKRLAQIPQTEGTFLKRLANPGPREGLGVDSWIAWMAAICMVLNILVPFADAQIESNMVVLRPLVMGLFVAALVLAMVACVPQRRVRGLSLSFFWVLGSLGGAWFLTAVWYELTQVGGAIRLDPAWYLNPGVLLFVLSWLLLGVASWVSLYVLPRERWVLIAATVVGIVGGAFILSDGGGVLSAQAVLEDPEIQESATSAQQYDVVVRVRNGGWRSLWLGRSLAEVPAPVNFVLERKIGPSSWESKGMPSGYQVGNGVWQALSAGQSLPLSNIRGGDSVAFRYALGAGSYRVIVKQSAPDEVSFTRNIQLLPRTQDEPIITVDTTEEPAVEEVDTESEMSEIEAESTPFVYKDNLVRLELQGIADAKFAEPRFWVMVHLPDGTTERKQVRLKEVVYGEWVASEYNPDSQSLTIGDGTDLLTLRRDNDVTVGIAQ